MCYIKKLLFLLYTFYLTENIAQENLIGFFQPKVAINYKVADNYKHIFSLAKRSYIFENEASTFRIRQLDLAHFSNLKIQDNQSAAFGIQFRFRDNFETEKKMKSV